MWLTRHGHSFSCGQPVEEPVPAAMMNVASNRRHATGARPKMHSSGKPADKFGKSIHNQHADDINEQFNEGIQLKHGLMVALFASNVKAGKCG